MRIDNSDSGGQDRVNELYLDSLIDQAKNFLTDNQISEIKKLAGKEAKSVLFGMLYGCRVTPEQLRRVMDTPKPGQAKTAPFSLSYTRFPNNFNINPTDLISGWTMDENHEETFPSYNPSQISLEKAYRTNHGSRIPSGGISTSHSPP